MLRVIGDAVGTLAHLGLIGVAALFGILVVLVVLVAIGEAIEKGAGVRVHHADQLARQRDEMEHLQDRMQRDIDTLQKAVEAHLAGRSKPLYLPSTDVRPRVPRHKLEGWRAEEAEAELDAAHLLAGPKSDDDDVLQLGRRCCRMCGKVIWQHSPEAFMACVVQAENDQRIAAVTRVPAPLVDPEPRGPGVVVDWHPDDGRRS